MDVVVWLRSLGLGKYEAIFRENDIDETVLPSLTHENLKELGVASFGHRVKLLDARAGILPAEEFERWFHRQARPADQDCLEPVAASGSSTAQTQACPARGYERQDAIR